MNTLQTIKPYPLDKLGYQKERYVLLPDGSVYDTVSLRYLTKSKDHKYSLVQQNGQRRTISLKNLFRQAYGIEFCIDTIEDLPDEEWREVVLDKSMVRNGLYYVSNLGRVKSYQNYEARIMKQQCSDKGYYYVELGGTNYRVHRLVALAFIPNTDKDKNTVDHINGDKALNTYYNLQWLSLLENIQKSSTDNEPKIKSQ